MEEDNTRGLVPILKHVEHPQMVAARLAIEQDSLNERRNPCNAIKGAASQRRS
jgi:hypothetical protein